MSTKHRSLTVDMMGSNFFYTCVVCQGALERTADDAWSCASCKETGKIMKGIPVFTKRKLSWTPVAPEIMERIVEESESGGSWREALLGRPEDISEYTMRYIMEEDRADWIFLLPVRKDWRALDLGSGWGSVSIPLSRWVGEVYCGDPTMLNCRFLKMRAEHEGIDNLHVFNSDPLDFPDYPFPEGSFDLIALNGVLEWTGNADSQSPVRDLQVKALKALKKLLAPGGYLYVGIENRYAYGAFLGQPVHFEAPFIGLLPRPIANAAMKIFKGRPHRTHIHGMRGYRRLLGEAGFESVDFYLPRPSYRDLFWLIPGNSNSGVRLWARHLAKGESPTKRIVRWWARRLPIRGIWPCYSIVCRNDEEK